MLCNVSSRRIRLRAIHLLVVASLAIGIAPVAIADTIPVCPRVRSSSAYLRGVIDGAARLSRTFRGLVAIIEATDGIVYVEPGACRYGARACMSLTVTPAGGYRFLRILVDANRAPELLMASIGHELQHAVEVLVEPTLVSSSAVYLFYARAGAVSHPFETATAIAAGFDVSREVEAAVRR